MLKILIHFLVCFSSYLILFKNVLPARIQFEKVQVPNTRWRMRLDEKTDITYHQDTNKKLQNKIPNIKRIKLAKRDKIKSIFIGGKLILNRPLVLIEFNWKIKHCFFIVNNIFEVLMNLFFVFQKVIFQFL